ncbi:hypothetical protein BCR42DRAFT_397282 [Absidia repens]|uniref:Heterokaryon incompatibility domain-containing protein n=1 Tax=Absidia repens TaxID=90262 RepID=A0A1X2I1N5_9FUNG|nr:hypothetical protein BCR42DRAFT_397282 [Absidia repens]
MTNDNPVEHRFRDITSEDVQKRQHQQQQQKPFQVVLVDIEKAAEDKKIHCIEKPLESSEEDLRFVALSYRWGELQEQVFDTSLGYLATITSFHLVDFYWICKMMIEEPDLKSIKYVWVDAICVDQTNYERRKATIQQMSNIYEKATYILAVPDLHREHLRSISTENYKIFYLCQEYCDYIYHLIQGNTHQLVKMDNEFLDKTEVPKDRILRQLLAKCTTYLADGFTSWQQNVYDIEHPEDALDILCEIYQASLLTSSHENLDFIKIKLRNTRMSMHPMNTSLLHYDNVANIILEEPVRRWMKIGKSDKTWTHELIKRKNVIQQIMKFLEDLIKDWSNRVWVISEYHIAKKKNNLKYCFIHLLNHKTFGLPFFHFDFTNPAFSAIVQNASFIYPKPLHDPNPVQLLFHRLIIKQLNTQTFFEMMLKSKASKNKDRFYAILPQSKYKDKLHQVDSWEINTMMSVKLKLFEIMDTKDKWTLFFLSGHRHSSNSYEVVPTFVASNIYWEKIYKFVDDQPCNFDISDESCAIQLCRTKNSSMYYIQLTPKEYYVQKQKLHNSEYLSDAYQHKKMLYNHLQLDKHSLLDIVFLPQYDIKSIASDIRERYTIYNGVALIGSFIENKWTLCDVYWNSSIYEYECSHYYNKDNTTHFNIY